MKKSTVKPPEKEKCEMCSRPATAFIGHPHFRCCGTHRNVVLRRIGRDAYSMSRTEIRVLMGFVYP